MLGVGVPSLVALVILIFRKRIYEEVTPFTDWFQINPISGFVIFWFFYFIWIPLVLPPFILTLVGGYTFSITFGAVNGYFLCLLAI